MEKTTSKSHAVSVYSEENTENKINSHDRVNRTRSCEGVVIIMALTLYDIYVNLFKTFSHVNEEAVLFFKTLTSITTSRFTQVAALPEGW